MKLPANCKIEAIASTDRLAISEPFLDGNRLIATDGCRIVVLPVEREPEDTDGHVSGKALAAARKAGRKNEATSLTCNSCHKLPDGSTMPRPTAESLGSPPQWKQVITTEDYPHKFSINARYLLEMVKAMGGEENVVLQFKDDHAPIKVGVTQNPEAIGILMPVRLT